jgi:hypothetical protein
MPCQDDIERGRRFRRILDLENESSRRQKQHNHDEDGRYGPSQLDLSAALKLSRSDRRIRTGRSEAEYSE